MKDTEQKVIEAMKRALDHSPILGQKRGRKDNQIDSLTPIQMKEFLKLRRLKVSKREAIDAVLK